jgi:acetolactate synthase-1/2/3 large subunit
MASRSGAKVLVESLAAEGVRTLFGIPGVDTLSVYDAFLDHPEIRAINVRHEQSAVFMADGFNRASGEVGVALTSGGPGALNTLTAMSTANNDSSAVLHVLNDNPAAVRRKGRGYFHDVADQFGIFRPVCDFAAQASLPAEIPGVIHSAMYALRSRRPRPALVEIAGDAFKLDTDAAIPARARSERRRPDKADIARAAELIAKAKRPIIWCGGGVVSGDASAEFVRIAEKLGAPILTSQTGKSGVRGDHPLFVGNWGNERPVRELIADADLLLAVGTRFSYFPTGAWSLKLPETIVQFDLDPAEIGRNYRVAASAVGDARVALVMLDEALDKLGYAKPADRTADVAALNQRIEKAIGHGVELDVLEQMRKALPAEAMIFNDPTTIVFWARSYWKSYAPRTWFVASGFGTLGFALPTAIGAAVARPGVPSIAMMGDAGVMFTIQDLMTAVEHKIPIILMIFNDKGYGVERRHQDHLYGRRSGVDLLPPDFVALAKAFGAKGVRVDDIKKVGETVKSVLGQDGPVVVEVPVDFKHPGYGAWVDWDKAGV